MGAQTTKVKPKQTPPKTGPKITEVTVGKRRYFRLYLGRRFLGPEQKPRQKYFASRAEANVFLRQQQIQLQNSGTAGFSLTDRERVDAAEAIKRLAEVNTTLSNAVDYFFKHAKPTGGTMLFSDAVQPFLDSRDAKNCKPRYVRNLKAQFDQLSPAFVGRNVNELRHVDIEQALAELASVREWNVKTRNNYIISLRAFFSFCIARKWCAENAATDVNKSRLDEVPVAIFTPADAVALLTATLRHAPSMLGPFAIGLFAGLRRSEVCQLDWSTVKTETIEVLAATAKTRRLRFVDIPANLATWIALCRKEEQGRVFTGSEDDYNEMRRFVAELADLDWPHNAIRHSAASYHLAYHEKPGYTALQLGHSEDVLFTHYRRPISRKEAAPFWNIYPSYDVTAGGWSATISKPLQKAALDRLVKAYGSHLKDSLLS